ncbi:tRNA glutamyl-Q(34) synthetase GluQRS [Paracoccus suum]|uniref:tRNA glutamyl-Q(34) synthetase GluQRS n=1 Tax=Paracoccus suum TaxID=2259340 RepID=A0A344PPB5_9RHOB|nr:tRNA glutamyl-Q(34) synthetase GluQRS [Paracoccus suum]AXC51220.1 tRNA glutamyl-Q(34) synthetase GluQRS [Paracoccus suum]
MSGPRTRFAPSPSGPLHLGHALAALTAASLARDGSFLVRIEDLDRSRCRPEYEAAIFADLAWLGLDWPRPVMRQSERGATYAEALDRLARRGLIYPCRCSRGDIRAALSAPQEGSPLSGPDGLIYPGTCRGRPLSKAGSNDALRLDAARALALTGPLNFNECCHEPGIKHMNEADFLRFIGDPVLARPSLGAAYHLAVVVDDAAQDITIVSRGSDLFDATWIHVLIQRLLDLPTPAYWHHPLVRDAEGRRLAKRDDARSLEELRRAGWTPAQVAQAAGFSGDMISTSAPSRTAV